MAVTRRIVPLTRDRLSELSASSWSEVLPATHPRSMLVPGADGGPAELAPWAEETLAEWGHCGMLAEGAGGVIGLIVLVPAGLGPTTGALGAAGSGADAAVLLSAAVEPDRRRQGIGRHLVQAAAADLIGRRVTALEAVGHRSGVVGVGGLPEDWLTAVGFRLVRDHPLAPRYRMSLSSTVRWRPDLAAAWQRIRGLVPQPTPPEPARFDADPAGPTAIPATRGATESC